MALGGKAQANLEDIRENRKAGDAKDSVGCAVESDKIRQSVDSRWHRRGR